ncbi:MAG: CotH kinase family protein [Myxococcota bacterium]
MWALPLFLFAVGAGCVAPAGDGAPGLVESGLADTAPDTDAIESIGDAAPVDESDFVFDPSVVHRIDLTMDAAAWTDIASNYTAENWQIAHFEMDGEVVADIGVRAFGAGSQSYGKTPIKLSFDRNVGGQEYRGLEQLKLDSSTQDAGYLNDPLAAWVLREMGLPAARTGWAELYVNGASYGFFVVLEPIDDVFLRRWFPDDEGALYGTWDWRYGQGLNPITWGGPLDWYVPQTAVETDGAELLAAIAAVNGGTDAEFAAHVDVDRLMGVSVTRAMMGAIDAYSADGNNFYLYDDHGRITMIPWDMDADLGYPGYFTNALEMGLEEPWLWSHARLNPITGATYSDPVYARARAAGWDVDGWAARVVAGPLDWETVDAKVVEWAAVIDEAACRDWFHPCAAHEARVADLRFFLHARLSRLAGAEVARCSGPSTLAYTSGAAPVAADVTTWGPGFVVNGEHFCTGVYAGAATLDTTVTAGTLRGRVGLHDWNGACAGGVTFTLSQGGAPLYDSGVVAPYTDAAAFSVPVSAGALTLTTTPSGGCGPAVWVDLAQ